MKTSYTCLKKMLDNANWAYDKAVENDLWELAFRYNKISIRILEAMGRNKVFYNYLKTGV